MKALPDSFLKKWIIATIIGWFGGFVAVVIFALIGESIGLPSTQFFVGIFIGLGIGWRQQLILNKVLDAKTRWMIMGTLGMSLPFIIVDFGTTLFPDAIDWSLNLAVISGALLSGILQFIELKKYNQNAWWWIFINLLAWTAAMGTLWIHENMRSDSMILNTLSIVFFVFGPCLILALVSGVGLKKILEVDS